MIKGKTVILGITGSIAAYKAADIASKLTQAGIMVEVIMTEPATRFISPLTLSGIVGRPVVTSMWELSSEFSIEHVTLAEAANVVVIAPATASTIAHLAAGTADDMLTCTVLATKAPVIIAPAMNDNMYNNPITQENIAKLKARGFIFVEPVYGRLASGKIGQGRLAEIDNILGIIRSNLGQEGDLAGKRICVTAGGTKEPIDPVRFIGNRSSGKMGWALASAARNRGAEVLLVSAADYLPETAGIQVVKVTTAAEMAKAVSNAVKSADALIMAAAVADYRPKDYAVKKIKKDDTSLTLELLKTPDVLMEVKGNLLKVGFAAESENLIANARKKLMGKKLDIVVANNIADTDCGFGSDLNRVTIIDKNGRVEALPLMSKREVADKILDWVVELIFEGGI
ncbi:MAG: bifunctional phosphopantothenoylcysteine decarboxylase/phosphopantothenate--cysteine ligase CoaBC [Dehalococcoidia bacterium]|nr:MAG: bifunctional phosphopantothenoylcysteine decarboxylase/phosphopantothenate--cysteine ligase CoaBC [Dehalococcoidia bacterium]